MCHKEVKEYFDEEREKLLKLFLVKIWLPAKSAKRFLELC